jgi:hypothetical protein
MECQIKGSLYCFGDWINGHIKYALHTWQEDSLRFSATKEIWTRFIFFTCYVVKYKLFCKLRAGNQARKFLWGSITHAKRISMCFHFINAAEELGIISWNMVFLSVRIHIFALRENNISEIQIYKDEIHNKKNS